MDDTVFDRKFVLVIIFVSVFSNRNKFFLSDIKKLKLAFLD